MYIKKFSEPVFWKKNGGLSLCVHSKSSETQQIFFVTGPEIHDFSCFSVMVRCHVRSQYAVNSAATCLLRLKIALYQILAPRDIALANFGAFQNELFWALSSVRAC